MERRMPLKFRNYINWYSAGIVWEETLHLPLRFIDFLYDADLSETDKVILLRIYSLLQDCDPTAGCQNEIAGLVEKMQNKSYVEVDADGDYSLLPIYHVLYPELEGEGGYPLFIAGEFRSFPFPKEFLDVLKHMKLTGKNGEKRNKTSAFILGFIFQLVTMNGEKFLKDDYYCGGKCLVADRDNLLYAIAKTCYESEHDWQVHASTDLSTTIRVKNGEVIADILDNADIVTASVQGESNMLDELTQTYFRLRDGDAVADTLKRETYSEWRAGWQQIIAEKNITAEEILEMLPALFDRYKYVPDPFKKPKPKNPTMTQLGTMMMVERERRRKKPPKKNNPLFVAEVIE